ncbi:PREDICTED: uncharacterized protein LOC109126626 [Camelina sativa]|uniref:Uncharacterized protein LOC109126626 n=1 Tax=Camelina sativa TaxID=90675 RepID=A0ABM1QGJ4_CAMSA|nr:PREDICTED: uncharacterized protein LOC109126626 [Camelina sativa]
MDTEEKIAANCFLKNNRLKHQTTQENNQVIGRSGAPTIILEAVADYDLWI